MIDEGSVGLVIAPLLISSAGGGSLRKDWRDIEDKLGNLGVALRDARLCVDTSQLHRNADRPIYYHLWIAITDCSLGPKGTGHRRVRGEEGGESQSQTPGNMLNIFQKSDLWRLQGLPLDALPVALKEGDFIVPSAKAHLQSHDSRRNLTDCQETSQWVGGEDIFSKLLLSILGTLTKCGIDFIDCFGFGLTLVHSNRTDMNLLSLR